MNGYTQPEWNTEKTRYYIAQNGHGHYWPKMEVLTPGFRGDVWGEIYIRDSNPFKTLAGAVKFIEKTRKHFA